MTTYIFDNSDDGHTWPEDFIVVVVNATNQTQAKKLVAERHPFETLLKLVDIVTDASGIMYDSRGS